MVRFVRGFAFNIALTAGVLLALAFVAKRFNVGGQLAEGSFGFGQTAGSLLSKPLGGLLSGFDIGLNDIAREGGKLLETGADIQRNITGGKTFDEALFGVDTQANQNFNVEDQKPIQSVFADQNSINTALQRGQQNLANALRIGQAKFGGTPMITDDLRAVGVSSIDQLKTPGAEQNIISNLIQINKEKFPKFFK